MSEVVRLRERNCKNCKQAFSYPIGKGVDRLHCTAKCRQAWQASRRPRFRQRLCRWCGVEFTYAVGIGKDRFYCGKECQKEYAKTRLPFHNRSPRPDKNIPCVRGCGRMVRTRAQECEACYCYKRRTGLDGPAPPPKRVGRYREKTGYIILNRPSHPLANKDGMIREHRVVAYDHYGPNDPPCYWCGTVLTWPDAVVDHLNEQKDDNRPENLVVACNDCNRARGAVVPFILNLKEESFHAFVRCARDLRSSPPRRVAA